MARLERGLYEQLISEALQAKLSEVGAGLTPSREPLRKAAAGNRLALHLAKLVERSTRPIVGSHEYALQRAYFDSPAAWKLIADGFDRLAEISDENGICVLIFIQPVLRQLNVFHPFRRIYDHVEAAAKERGLEASQAVDYVVGHDEDEVRFGSDDIHPTPEGHRLYAVALEDALRALPSRCGFPPLGKAGREG